MKELMSYKSDRLLNIVQALLLQSDITISDIQDLNQCSKTTAYEDVDTLLNKWGGPLGITTNKAQIFLENRAISDVLVIKESLLKEEIGINILLYLFFNPHIQMYDLVETIGYSESYIRKHISTLNEYLVPFESTIHYNTSQRSFALKTTREFNLHYLIAELLKLTNRRHQVLHEDNHDYFVDTLEKDLDIHLPDQVRSDFTLLYGVAMLRLHQGFYSDEELQQFYQNEIRRLTSSHILENARIFFITSLNGYFQESSLQLTDFQRTQLYEIFISIVVKAVIYPRRVDDVCNRYDLFFEEFKFKNGHYVSQLKELVSNFHSAFNIDLTPMLPEITFHLYTHLHGLRVYRSYKIGILSDLGLNHAMTLKISIEKHFPHQSLSLYNPKEDYDLLVTTTTRSIERSSNQIQSVVTISDHLNERDFSRIFTYLYKIMAYQ